jgi:hypothetical protein
MKRILLFIWQLPQNLAGLAVILAARAYKDGAVWRAKKNIGVCLGDFIIISVTADTTTVKHEEGHQKQSLYLGPLYLPAVGIPSAIFCNLWNRLFHKDWPPADRQRWYYSRYPERWADKLGGVSR